MIDIPLNPWILMGFLPYCSILTIIAIYNWGWKDRDVRIIAGLTGLLIFFIIVAFIF